MPSRTLTRPALAAATAAVAVLSLAACGSSSKATGADQPSAAASGAGGTGAAGQGGQGGAFGGRIPGTSGQIAAKQGTTLQVQNRTDGQVAVTYTASTAISAQVSAALADVKVGSCVNVIPVMPAQGATQGSAGSASAPTSITAGTVRISSPVNGACTGGFGGGFGGAGGGRGGFPSGATSGFPTTRPSGFPSGRPSGRPSGAPGARGFFGANGTVAAVTDTGFTVVPSFPGRGAGGSSSAAPSATPVTVTVDGSTTYTITKAADASALKVGKCVMATGQADSTGAVTADRLVVSDPVDGACTVTFGLGRGPGGTGQAGSQAGGQADPQGGAA